jgi:hypothetical protein
MKKLLVILFSLFFLSSPSVFADDISDFSIEGISIGDSLLDYMTEGEILEEIERNKNVYFYLNEPNKYAEVYFTKDFPTYDSVSVSIKNNSPNKYVINNNEKYSIMSIRGLILHNEDFDKCIQKRDEIVDILSKTFPNTTTYESFSIHPGDPSGKSISDAIHFYIDSVMVSQATCLNLEENFRIKNNLNDVLQVSIYSEEIVNWLRDSK